MKIIEHVNAIVIEQIKYLLVCLHDACEIGSSASVQREIEREKQAILRASLVKKNGRNGMADDRSYKLTWTSTSGICVQTSSLRASISN